MPLLRGDRLALRASNVQVFSDNVPDIKFSVDWVRCHGIFMEANPKIETSFGCTALLGSNEEKCIEVSSLCVCGSYMSPSAGHSVAMAREVEHLI